MMKMNRLMHRVISQGQYKHSGFTSSFSLGYDVTMCFTQDNCGTHCFKLERLWVGKQRIEVSSISGIRERKYEQT